jgi:NADPH:quinone reductase-like Zn-dependent oxidoreductase
VEFGPEVESPIQLGERVTAWTVVATCQRCEQCTTGHPNRCALEYRYLGAHLPGSYAQYITLPAVNLVRIPDRMTWEEAAAFPAPYGTAWHMLVTRANLRPAETILVQSASAAVSIAGIQIAKLIGAYVYATTSSDWKVERAREVGADEVINYTQIDFQQEIMRRTGKRGVDMVLEHVGGPVFDKSVRSLTRGGRLVTTGGTASYDVTTSVAHIFHKELSIIGSNSYIRHELEVMMPLVERGLLHPVVDRVFPLQEAAAAHRHVMGGDRFGKVVLRVTH